MKIKLLGSIVVLFAIGQTALATEYIYRDLMANTIPPVACASEKEAVSKATQPYTINRFSKKFCQSQGYGWHVEAIKADGNVVCQDCSGAVNGNKRCFVEDIVVSCKRIKPGSVGLLPGKG